MKNVFKFAVAAFCVAALAVSCQITTDIEVPEENSNLVTLKCEFPSLFGSGTKVTLDGDKKTCWEVGDEIVFQGCPKDGDTPVDPVVHTIIASEIVNPRVAEITVDLSSLIPDEGTPKRFNVAYPASKWSSYSSSHTYGRSRFTGATNQLLMAGYIEDDMSSITLNHVTGVILFKVPADLDGLVDSYTFVGNNSEVLGYEKYLVEINSNSPSYLAKLGAATYGTLDPVSSLSGPVTADGTTVHAVYIQNAANMTDGFTIQFKKSGDIKYTISTSTRLNLVHGHGVDLGTLPMSKIHEYVAPASHDATNPAIAGATDLSASGTANCYIVDGSDDGNQNKVFKFKAYKGNSTTSVGTIASVEILWETYNDANTVTANSVVAAVDFDKQALNDYYEIVFQMPASLHAGNALIAAKSAGDDILWSWHIWVPSTTIATNTYGLFTSALMDRYLGALVAATTESVPVQSYGLSYQWGRKDPFLGAKSNTSSSNATVAGTSTSVAAGKITLAESIASPTVLGFADGDNWMTESDNTLWNNSAKTIYDPCPVGYRVPARDTAQPLMSSDFTGVTGWADNKTGYYFTLGDPVTVFPYSGYRDDSSPAGITHAGDRVAIWTAYASAENKAYHLNVRSETDYHGRGETAKSRGGFIRCVAE